MNYEIYSVSMMIKDLEKILERDGDLEIYIHGESEDYPATTVKPSLVDNICDKNIYALII